MEGKKPDLLNLVEQLSTLADAYESLYLLACCGGDVGADRVAALLSPLNDDLAYAVEALDRLRKAELNTSL